MELTHQNHNGIKIRGTVNPIFSIPSDYKQKIKNVSNSVQESYENQKNEDLDTKCDDDELCEGSGAKKFHADDGENRLGHGVYFAGGGFMPCDDDEDICDNGSGASESSMRSPVTFDKSVGSSSSKSERVDCFLVFCALLKFL